MTDAAFTSAFAAPPDGDVLTVGTEHTGSGRFTGRLRALSATPGIATWIGVALIAAGAIVVAVGWARSAGITEVGRQIPILISAGFTGLGLLVVGVTIVNLSAKAQESQRRRDQADELASVLAAIRVRLAGAPDVGDQ
jgi:hypothetical protein